MNKIADVEIDACIKKEIPGYKLILIEADIVNGVTPDALTDELTRLSDSFRQLFKIEDVAHRPGVSATRAAYKAFGKDPNRYRPSQEQMMRRIIRGLGLYSISALVDGGNLLSLLTGYSVGAFDADKVEGDRLYIGIGKDGEPYEGIGRGPLNIAGMPVVRDAVGGMGTPTSDNERTKSEIGTTRLLMTIHIFGEDMPIGQTINTANRILTDYCSASGIDVRVFG